MVKTLEKAFAKAANLPEGEQARLAELIFAEIESETEWATLIADPRSPGMLEQMAEEALAEDRAGNTTPLDFKKTPRVI